VSDVLIDLLIVELRRMDLIEKWKLTDFDSQKCKNLDRVQRFITSLGIPGYNFWVGKQSKELKWRTLTGPEKLTLFRNINIQNLLPNSPETTTIKIQVLWIELLQLHEMFSKGPDITEEDICNFESQSRQWVKSLFRFIRLRQLLHTSSYVQPRGRIHENPWQYFAFH